MPFDAVASLPCSGHHSALPRRMVGVPGVEPGTSSLSGTRSNQLSYTPFFTPRSGASKGKPFGYGHWLAMRCSRHFSGRQAKHGGGKGVRTPDPELAKLVLSQLSYAPKICRLPLLDTAQMEARAFHQLNLRQPSGPEAVRFASPAPVSRFPGKRTLR
jgi:hypothetical protein